MSISISVYVDKELALFLRKALTYTLGNGIIYVCVHVHNFVYVYMCVCMCVQVHIHTYTYVHAGHSIQAFFLLYTPICSRAFMRQLIVAEDVACVACP